MKAILIGVMVVIGSVAWGADAPQGAMDPKMAEMMKQWQAYATPGEQHKKLNEMAGKWKYTSKFWESEGGKAEESKGMSHMKMILGGRWLEHKISGMAMGQKFEGLGLTGFDNIKGIYETLWIDTMGTGVMHGEGAFDKSTNTLTDKGEGSCPMSPTKKRAFRNEMKIVDKNNMVFSMYGPGHDGGKEFKQGEIIFKRVN